MGTAPVENQNKPSLAPCMEKQIPETIIIGRVGVATIGVEQHTFRTTVFGFEWVRHHWKTKKTTIIGNTHGEPNFRKIKLIGDWGGDDWG